MSSHHWFVHSFVSQPILLGICCTLNTHSGALLGEPVIFPNELVKCRIELDWQPRQVSSLLCSASSVLCNNLRQETPPLWSISISETRAGKPVISSHQGSIFKCLPRAFTNQPSCTRKGLESPLKAFRFDPVGTSGGSWKAAQESVPEQPLGPETPWPSPGNPDPPLSLCQLLEARLIREESRCQS